VKYKYISFYSSLIFVDNLTFLYYQYL